MKRNYDSTVARIAGNIASGLVTESIMDGATARRSVALARMIVAEVERMDALRDIERARQSGQTQPDPQ